jgi:hypothetical protein
MTDYTTFKILSIDAWREPEGGWTWNNAHTLEEGVMFSNDQLTPRRILAALRKWGYLTSESKGRCRVDDGGTCGDLYEIQDKNTGKPLLALSTIH